MISLLALFILPFIAACVLFSMMRAKSTTTQTVSFILSSLPLLYLVWGGYSWLGSSYDVLWFPALSIHFHLAVDNLSLLFLYIVNVITPISILAKRPESSYRPNFFYATILLLQWLLIGFFTAKDLVFFTFFFEAILIPSYLLINTWGGEGRKKAAFTFIIYMVAGSALTVAAVLALYLSANSFDLDILAKTAETHPNTLLIALAFLVAFAVKTPLFPFHAWLADAYCQAPTPATILLSGILSKAGIYGIIRISLGLFPMQMHAWSPLLLTLAIIGVLYGAFAAWGQTDFKRLIAYSSFSHVNFVLAGLFVWNQMAQGGAILQAVNHSVTVAGLFLVAGWLEMRLGTTSYGNVSGLTSVMPCLSWMTLFFVLSAVALPGLNSFISEVMILYGVFKVSFWLSLLLGLTVILSILYMLRWQHSVFFDVPSPPHRALIDLKATEVLTAVPLIALVLWLGIYPATALSQVEPAAKKIPYESITR